MALITGESNTLSHIKHFIHNVHITTYQFLVCDEVIKNFN